MRLQQNSWQKRLNRSTLIGGIAGLLLVGWLYHTLSRTRQPPAEPIVVAPVAEPITALGRLEPGSEVVQVAAPTALNNDRISQLLVKRGDRCMDSILTIPPSLSPMRSRSSNSSNS